MKEVITLYRADFSNLENRPEEAAYSEKLGVFMGDGKLTAHGKVSKFISKLEPMTMYLGWNGKVYPQFRLEKDLVK